MAAVAEDNAGQQAIDYLEKKVKAKAQFDLEEGIIHHDHRRQEKSTQGRTACVYRGTLVMKPGGWKQ
ncbi:MAG: hypothetical protein IJI21_10840 [Clostridia bacterium]|nr:hypothetical protein [Clostridia bacterium]